MKLSEVYLIEDIYMQIVAFGCFMFTELTWGYFFLRLLSSWNVEIIIWMFCKASFYTRSMSLKSCHLDFFYIYLNSEGIQQSIYCICNLN